MSGSISCRVVLLLAKWTQPKGLFSNNTKTLSEHFQGTGNVCKRNSAKSISATALNGEDASGTPGGEKGRGEGKRKHGMELDPAVLRLLDAPRLYVKAQSWEMD